MSAARSFVREHVESSPAAALAADAALVVTELVSNAVLHGTGPVVVSTCVEVGPPVVVRVEVQDASPVPPAVRDYGSGASTGRGLAVVARIASRWGAERVGSGKAVWAELSTEVGSAVERRGLGVPPPATTMAPQAEASIDNPRPVRFLGVPVRAFLRLQEQNDAVLRELELLAFTADHAGEIEPSPELVDVIERSRRYFNASREGFRADVVAAGARGERTIDLTSAASMSSLDPTAELVALFEQAEELARRGELLIGPPDHDVGRLRRWFVSEMSAQLLDGAPPTPFPPS